MLSHNTLRGCTCRGPGCASRDGHNTVAAASGNSGESAAAKAGGHHSRWPSRLFLYVGAGRAVAGAVAGLLLVAGTAPVQAQGIRVEVRAGVAASTALVRDAIATGSVADSVLPPGKTVQAASVSVAPSPVVTVAFVQESAGRLGLEAELGWTFGRLHVAGGAGGYRLGTVGIGQAAVAARWQLPKRSYARAGAGVLGYGGWSAGVFRGDRRLEPMAEVGAGSRLPVAGSRVTIGLTLQAHPFRTAGLADAGEQSGGVLRGLLQAGIVLGGRP